MSLIGITMGCPVGIGPEILLKYFATLKKDLFFTPIIIGDIETLAFNARHFDLSLEFVSWKPGEELPSQKIPVYNVSTLTSDNLHWGKPNDTTSRAMASYIEAGVQLIDDGIIDAITTCPIAKISLQKAGYDYPGHTEMLADLTKSKHFTMMMAGSKLRVTLATIHCALADVPQGLNQQLLIDLIRLTHSSLQSDFDIGSPRIGIAGLNPHASEDGIFGNEESSIIEPAVAMAQEEGIDAIGPLPPDTIFFQAAEGKFDTVVCMYHDQGLIPFKLLHFSDGVNVTLGLPIVRTSVDHGTAYDIAGKGIASPLSLDAAVNLAATIVKNRMKNR